MFIHFSNNNLSTIKNIFIMKKIFTLFAIMMMAISVNVKAQSGSCGDNLKWTFFEDVDAYALSITGSGAMTNYTDVEEVPWSEYIWYIEQIYLPIGLTSIGDYAFSECGKISSMAIPEGVTTIGANAFYGCNSLSSINIPDGVTTIGANAFNNCYKIKTLTLPSSVTTIGSGAFYGSGLASVNLPEGLTTIESRTFGWSYLTSISIPNGVTSIGSEAFYGCDRLTSVVIPSSMTEIGSKAFSGCKVLESFTCEATTPPTLAADCFNNVSAAFSIYVPSEAIEAYKAAEGWSDFGANIKPSTTGIANLSIAAEKKNVGKFLHNGKLVIVKDGKQYNAAGQKM